MWYQSLLFAREANGEVWAMPTTRRAGHWWMWEVPGLQGIIIILSIHHLDLAVEADLGSCLSFIYQCLQLKEQQNIHKRLGVPAEIPAVSAPWSGCHILFPCAVEVSRASWSLLVWDHTSCSGEVGSSTAKQKCVLQLRLYGSRVKILVGSFFCRAVGAGKPGAKWGCCQDFWKSLWSCCVSSLFIIFLS